MKAWAWGRRARWWWFLPIWLLRLPRLLQHVPLLAALVVLAAIEGPGRVAEAALIAAVADIVAAHLLVAVDIAERAAIGRHAADAAVNKPFA